MCVFWGCIVCRSLTRIREQSLIKYVYIVQKVLHTQYTVHHITRLLSMHWFKIFCLLYISIYDITFSTTCLPRLEFGSKLDPKKPSPKLRRSHFYARPSDFFVLSLYSPRDFMYWVRCYQSYLGYQNNCITEEVRSTRWCQCWCYIKR